MMKTDKLYLSLGWGMVPPDWSVETLVQSPSPHQVAAVTRMLPSWQTACLRPGLRTK